jgi:ABC-type multidrug transport system fused ATPase/permease subunit
VIEAVAFGGIILLCLVLIARSGGIGSDAVATVLPVLGLYSFAGYRLLPAFQQIFSAAASFRVAGAAIDSVYSDVAQRDALPNLAKRNDAPLPLREALTFEHASYHYPNGSRPSIDNLSLTIPVGSRIGVVGSTGAGKTTFVDLLLGVLRPTTGRIRADGVELDDQSVRAWQRNVGYVPQEIFLVDASIIENVAFEFSGGPIDEARVVQCLRAARLHDFVMNEMHDGLKTRVGERGVRMSGGQRQRLGIARALYHDPAMLILDEATSALDNVTEMEVMEAVTALSRTKTVVMVAHRLSSLRSCETILLLKHGRLAAAGPYDTLLRESDDFRVLAELA